MTLAMVFPGQGSQSVGMLAEFADTAPVVRESFEQAGAALGYDLWQLVTEGPAERLNSTEYTQPALLTAGVALWRLWQQRGGPAPALLAGHSLGEYTALCCAGAFSLESAVALVAERGRLMQTAVPAGAGAMAAILGLDDAAVAQICGEAAEGAVCTCANYNMPGQVVIAGDKTAVERACALARERGARRALPLPVSVPSHCALMRPAAEALAGVLAGIDIAMPAVPVLQNVDAAAADSPASIRQRLVAQLAEPVQWVRCVRRLQEEGAGQVLECGPGKVLSGLCGRSAPGLECRPLGTVQAFERALTECSA